MEDVNGIKSKTDADTAKPLWRMREYKITLLGISIGIVLFLLVLFMMDAKCDRYNDQMISLLGSVLLFVSGLITAFLGAKWAKEFKK